MVFSGNIFPIQKLVLREKDDEWRKANVNHIISRRNSNYIDRTNRKDLIQCNYDLLDSIYNEKDLLLVTNPYKVDDGFPATPQNFNIIRPKIDLLIGEESKKPFNFMVTHTSDVAASMLQEKKKELLLQFVDMEIKVKVNPNDPDLMERMTLTDIENYVKKEYKSIPEKLANITLNNAIERLNIPQEFLRGFKDALATGEEIYYTGIQNGDVIFERCNPLYCDFDKRPDLVFIEDGDWFLRWYRMSPATIYDRMFDMMDEEQLDQLQKMSNANYTSSGGGANVNWSPPITFSVNNIKEILLDVFHCIWKSYKKVGYLTYMDEQGELQHTMVDETYVVQPGEQIDWDWVIEIWEGYRIGADLYIGIKPIEYQYHSIDNPNAKKLPYSGAIHGKPLVSMMKPLQYMYIILWYRLELTLARDKGKILTMDITQIPKSMNINVDRWLHYLSATGINFVNPYEEGWDIPGREGGKASQFNQISSQDLSMSNVIAGYIQLIEKVEEMIGEISGVSRQRQGSIQTSELVGNVERAVVQSSNITEPLFWLHNQAKKNALTNLLNATKYAWSVNQNKKVHYLMDDATRVFMDVTEDFLYSDFDIFVTDSTKEFHRLEALKTLLQSALQSGASLSEAAEIITSDNIRSIKEKLADIDMKKQQIEQQQQESQNQIQQMQLQQQQQIEGERIRLDEEDSIRKSNTALEVAMINAESKVKNTDSDYNGVDDMLDLQRLEMEREQLNHTMQKEKQETDIKRRTLDAQVEKQRSDARLKQKEIEVKRIAANKKPVATKAKK
jgi:hypothetical protein